MDPQSVAFQPRDDFWRIQDEMLRVQQSQAELSDRVSRLERQRDDDSRLKNVWGTSSPFPSVLGGTPQQGKTLFALAAVAKLTLVSTLAATHGRALLQLR
jgi:hypothetical protein